MPKKVLIIEPDSIQRKGMTVALKSHAHVETIVCPKSAWPVLKERRFDIIITDLFYTGEATFHFLAKLRQMAPESYIMVLSRDVSDKDRRSIEECGVDCYWEKPVNIQKLIELLNQ